MDRRMRTIVLTGLLVIALLGAILGAIGGRGATWVSADDDGTSHRTEPACVAGACAPALFGRRGERDRNHFAALNP
jgi:hypothetical protein